MKTLVLFALSFVASAAMAAGPVGSSSISISGSSNQLTSISGAIVTNKASGTDAEALQNMASNAGNVSISGRSVQRATVGPLSLVSNEAAQDAIAQQNLASNVGKVMISGNSEQSATVQLGGILTNVAGVDTVAQQSLSSNVGNVTVAGNSIQNTMVGPLAAVLNAAYGRDAKAVQNISSNNSCSTFTCANSR